MPLYGTKACNDVDHSWAPDTLGELYRKIADDLRDGNMDLVWKPKPGECYRKAHKPISKDTDYPSFRRAPSDIIITQPPRLFRTVSWKYRKNTYWDCECFWHFQFKFWNPEYEILVVDRKWNGERVEIERLPACPIEHQDWDDRLRGEYRFNRGWQYQWLPVYVLTNYYLYNTVEFEKPNKKSKQVQLELF